MYEAFFGFRESPFRVTPDPRFLYHNATYDEAIAALSYGIEHRKGFVTLVGEVGTGKTTLLRNLLDTIAPNVRTVLLIYPTVSFLGILEQILTELGIPVEGASKSTMIQRLHEFLLEHTTSGGNVALLFDEAQALASETLEELRLLSNLETGSEKIVQIVLAGQPELEAKLRRPEHRQLRQRVALHIRLAPLALDEVPEYVRTRLEHAGAPDLGLFEPEALARISEVTGGIPRVVNVLCDACCTTALAAEQRRISRAIVDEAWADYAALTADEPASGQPTPAQPQRPDATQATPPREPEPEPVDPETSDATAILVAPPPPPSPQPKAAPPAAAQPSASEPAGAPEPAAPVQPLPSLPVLAAGGVLAALLGGLIAYRLAARTPGSEPFAAAPPPTLAITRAVPTTMAPPPTIAAPEDPEPPVTVELPAAPPSPLEALDVVDAFRLAYESEDLAALTALFTANARKGEIIGRDAITADYERFFASTDGIVYAQPSASVEPRTDHVLVRAPFEITYRDLTSRPVEVRGQATWKIVRLDTEVRIASLDFEVGPVAVP